MAQHNSPGGDSDTLACRRDRRSLARVPREAEALQCLPDDLRAVVRNFRKGLGAPT
ncbi:MAG: hypothetical protein WD448_13535 [Woeseia sp.]